MSELSQNDMLDPAHESEHGRRRHKKKRRHRKKIYRQVIIAALFVLACVVAMAAWHFLVQEPAGPRRTSWRNGLVPGIKA